MANFSKITVGDAPRVELHDALKLTGAEVSINNLKAGQGVPFVHAHKQNEEVYGVISGKGELFLDDEVFPIKTGDYFMIPPEGKRAIRAAVDSDLSYICIQTQKGSLEGFTMSDAVICEEKAPWQRD